MQSEREMCRFTIIQLPRNCCFSFPETHTDFPLYLMVNSLHYALIPRFFPFFLSFFCFSTIRSLINKFGLLPPENKPKIQLVSQARCQSETCYRLLICDKLLGTLAATREKTCMSGFHMTMHIVFAADVNTASKPVRDTHMKIMKTKRNRATAKKNNYYIKLV